MPSTAINSILEVVSLIASAFTVIKLYRTGLYRRYRVFFWYFIFRTPNLAWPLLLNVNSQLYFALWGIVTPLIWFFHVAIVMELYRLILERHKGLYTLGRWAMYAATIGAVVLSILSLLPRFTPAIPQRSKFLGYYLAIDRGVDLSLVLFILGILAFLSLYPVPLSRNVIVHVAIFSIYFLSSTLTVLIRAVLGIMVNAQVNLALTAVSAICAIAWAILLKSKGEEIQTRVPVFGPEHEERVLRQLDAINNTLLKVSHH